MSDGMRERGGDGVKEIFLIAEERGDVDACIFGQEEIEERLSVFDGGHEELSAPVMAQCVKFDAFARMRRCVSEGFDVVEESLADIV